MLNTTRQHNELSLRRTPLGPALNVRLSRKSKKMTEVKEEQSLGVHLREASISYRVKQNDQRTTGTKGVHFKEVSA